MYIRFSLQAVLLKTIAAIVYSETILEWIAKFPITIIIFEHYLLLITIFGRLLLFITIFHCIQVKAIFLSLLFSSNCILLHFVLMIPKWIIKLDHSLSLFFSLFHSRPIVGWIFLWSFCNGYHKLHKYQYNNKHYQLSNLTVDTLTFFTPFFIRLLVFWLLLL